ncbi:unnamed protein product [Rangifer tarandus platyrhynchus]|uniref:Uncharacterized protein n=1 Tax=Rangifer tarandus platyrhynchus TaxID=3082113 RepID=A0ABN9A6E7_RANTA|nr:unnamed protein product [Rangifer tarandus platyrhynchus]
MTKATRKPRPSRRVAMRFASRKNGMKKTLCQRRGRRGVKARNMTMRVRRPPQGTFRKKIRSYATQSTKPKKTRKANRFFSGCGRTKYDHEGQKTSTRDLQKENPIVCHSIDEAKENKKSKPFFSGCGRTKYDHEGQKTSTRDLQKENPIVCHSIDEAKENKKSKPILLWLWT